MSRRFATALLASVLLHSLAFASWLAWPVRPHATAPMGPVVEVSLRSLGPAGPATGTQASPGEAGQPTTHAAATTRRAVTQVPPRALPRPHVDDAASRVLPAVAPTREATARRPLDRSPTTAAHSPVSSEATRDLAAEVDVEVDAAGGQGEAQDDIAMAAAPVGPPSASDPPVTRNAATPTSGSESALSDAANATSATATGDAGEIEIAALAAGRSDGRGEAGTGGGGAGLTSSAGGFAYYRDITRKVERNLRYPRRAQRERIEGVVLVRVEIDRGGRVLETAVTDSSGSKLLDRDARRTIERAAPFGAVPSGVGESDLAFEIPVTYEAR